MSAECCPRITAWVLVPALPLTQPTPASLCLLGLSCLVYKRGTMMPSVWGCREDAVFVRKPSALPGTEYMPHECGG